jgi:hypothetical protein
MKGVWLSRHGPHKAIPWQADFPCNCLHLLLFERRSSHQHTGGISLVGDPSKDVDMIEGQGHNFTFKSN